jgi:hypothetical protein
MSQTKVHIPALSPLEYHMLVEALKFYHETSKREVMDTTTDSKARSIARANATLSGDLLEKIG